MRQINVIERKALHRLLWEMGKDDIMNLIFHLIVSKEINVEKVLNTIMEQDHISDKPYTWTDYANGMEPK